MVEIKISKKPRIFKVGENKKIKIKEVGFLYLKKNEQITFKTIDNFYVSFLNFTFFLKLLIGAYLIMTALLNFVS